MIDHIAVSPSHEKSREGAYNIVDKFLPLDEVCSQFGLFVKLLCDTQQMEPAMSTSTIAMRNYCLPTCTFRMWLMLNCECIGGILVSCGQTQLERKGLVY